MVEKTTEKPEIRIKWFYQRLEFSNRNDLFKKEDFVFICVDLDTNKVIDSVPAGLEGCEYAPKSPFWIEADPGLAHIANMWAFQQKQAIIA